MDLVEGECINPFSKFTDNLIPWEFVKRTAFDHFDLMEVSDELNAHFKQNSENPLISNLLYSTTLDTTVSSVSSNINPAHHEFVLKNSNDQVICFLINKYQTFIPPTNSKSNKLVKQIKGPHNAIEKRYRASINERIDQLRDMLSQFGLTFNKRCKSVVLQTAIDRLYYLERENAQLKAKIEFLKPYDSCTYSMGHYLSQDSGICVENNSLNSQSSSEYSLNHSQAPSSHFDSQFCPHLTGSSPALSANKNIESPEDLEESSTCFNQMPAEFYCSDQEHEFPSKDINFESLDFSQDLFNMDPISAQQIDSVKYYQPVVQADEIYLNSEDCDSPPTLISTQNYHQIHDQFNHLSYHRLLVTDIDRPKHVSLCMVALCLVAISPAYILQIPNRWMSPNQELDEKSNWRIRGFSSISFYLLAYGTQWLLAIFLILWAFGFRPISFCTNYLKAIWSYLFKVRNNNKNLNKLILNPIRFPKNFDD